CSFLSSSFFSLVIPLPPISTLFPYTTLFRSSQFKDADYIVACDGINSVIRDMFTSDFGTKIELKKNKFVWLGSTKPLDAFTYFLDRKSTRLNSSHVKISYAVFCLKKKNTK